MTLDTNLRDEKLTTTPPETWNGMEWIVNVNCSLSEDFNDSGGFDVFECQINLPGKYKTQSHYEPRQALRASVS
jgi:hypothetical protein